MTQIRSIRLGLVAICIATVPFSQAQMPRTPTSGATTGATMGHSGLIGNSTSAPQIGINTRSSTSTGPNTNAAAHIGMNAGAQAGISNPTGGIIGGPAVGLSGLNSTSAAQTGTNFRGSTSTGPTANVGSHIGINAGAQTGISNQI